MFTRHFLPARFLRSVCGTEPFRDYCQSRGIAFGRVRIGPLSSEELTRWVSAVEQLPRDTQAEIEFELRHIHEMAAADAVAHLTEAADDAAQPPPDVPGGAPVALWYYLHHRDLFHEVFFRHQFAATGSWRTGTATPKLEVADLTAAADRLAEEVREAFRVEGENHLFGTADAHRIHDTVVFVVQVADRVRLVEGFSDRGEASVQRIRPATSVIIAYEPSSGRVRLKSPLRARQRVHDLFDRFGAAVLGGPVTPDPFVYDLDRLKRPLALLPDAPDMEAVRLKALHLRYPPHLARRRLCFETTDGDEPTAIAELIAAHVSPLAIHDLTVSHAELQVRLRAGDRIRRYVVRLWPDRCSLNHTPFGDRMRECLRRWGLTRV